MTFKYIFAFAIAAVASAAIIPPEHPIHEYSEDQKHSSQPAYQYAAPTPNYQHAIPATQHHSVIVEKHHDKEEELGYAHDPHPQYNFSYYVQDAISGDSKSQSESRDGDVVHGEYSLNDADGYRRTVKYTASDANGFNAVVHREPLEHKIVAATAAAPAHHYHYDTSVSYAAPTADTKASTASNEQHSSYVSYEAPQQNNDENYHHHH